MRFLAIAAIGALWLGPAAQAEPEACKLPLQNAGRSLFAENCTLCHGTDGKGGGPLAIALNLMPPDLTALKTAPDGRFPSDHVLSVLKNGSGETSEGDKTMPVWSKIFSHECGEEYGQQAIEEIRRYLETIQAAKVPAGSQENR